MLTAMGASNIRFWPMSGCSLRLSVKMAA